MNLFGEATVIVPSLAIASEAEVDALAQNTEREREWYAGAWVYKNWGSISAGWVTQRLVQVEGDDNLALIGRLRNPDLQSQFPSYLLPIAAATLKAMGTLWRKELAENGIDLPEARLSVTSLIRSQDRQDQLAADATKLASPDSTHTRGGAFDLDLSGYYVINADGKLAPVMHPERSMHLNYYRAGKMLRELSDPTQRYSTPQTEVEYDPHVMDALLVVADRLHQMGIINRIVEYQDASDFNRGLHVAAHPVLELTA